MKKILLLSMISVALLMFSCGQKSASLSEDSGKAYTKFGIALNDAVVCKGVENYKAIDPAEKFQTDGSGTMKVYILCGVKVEMKDQSLIHRFSKLAPTIDGSSEVWQPYYRLPMIVKPSKDFRTFSFITATPGKYRADIIASDDVTVIKTLFFEVEGDVTAVEPIDPESEARVELKDSRLCERIEKSMPVNPATSFRAGPVFVWVETEATGFPSKVFYRWSKKISGLGDATGWVIEQYQTLEIKGNKWRTYAYRNCGEGDWQVDILSSDAKKLLKSFEFKVLK